MTPEPTRLGRLPRYRIVVGLDLSEYADIVLDHALDQAARHDAPELHLVTVREKRKPGTESLKQTLWERVYPSLQTFNQFGLDWRARLHVRHGKPDEQIAQLAAEIRADLIVIGHFGLHNPKHGDNNLPNRIMQAAVCPTLVVGMPEAIEAQPQCPMCAAVREDDLGWFCPEHVADRRAEPAVSTMTTWSLGSLMY